MTDAQLIQQYLAGDVQAFNMLVWRWQKPVYNFILRYLGREEDAKDLTQKTFIKAYKNLRNLKDHRKFASWLYQIALNLCRDEQKKKRPNFSLESINENHHLLTVSARNPEQNLQRTELAILLQKALNLIPEEQRTVVILKEFQGFKFAEIAELLDIPVNTAKSRMYYGLNALRKILNQWHIDLEALYHDL